MWLLLENAKQETWIIRIASVTITSPGIMIMGRNLSQASSRSFFRNLPETIAITSKAVFHLASSSAFCPLSISKILPKAASMLAFSPETFVEATE